MEIITLACSILAVVLCLVILIKVNKILDNLHTPIVKKLSSDMNLRPSSRKPLSAQDMAQRGEKNKDSRKGSQNKEYRGEKNGQTQSAPNRRSEQRDTQTPRREKRERIPERPVRREQNVETSAPQPAPAVEPATPVVSDIQTPVVEGRRPLAPRIPAETPEAPATPINSVAEPSIESVETVFDPSKVRYGRRNVIKKAPELSDDI